MPSLRSNVRTVSLDELRSRLAVFEERHGVTSGQLYDYFTVDGVLHEDGDFLEWSFLYGTVRDLAARND